MRRAIALGRHLGCELTSSLVLRLLLVMLLYTACRAIFYATCAPLLGEMSPRTLARAFTGGLLFDAAAVSYTNLWFALCMLLPLRRRVSARYQRMVGVGFVVVNSLALAANLFDVGFYKLTLRRSTAVMFGEFAHERNLHAILGRAIVDHWPLPLALCGMVALLWYARAPRAPWCLFARIEGRAYYVTTAAVLLVAGFWLSVACRGGLYTRHHRPITLSNAGAYVDAPHQIPLVLNAPFGILRTIRQPPLQKTLRFKNEESLARIFDPTHRAAPLRASPKNIVIIILESFGAENVGFLQDYTGGGARADLTPFLDSLAKKSLSFVNAFANGGKTIDALPSITASIPFIIQPFLLSRYSSNRINTVANMLAPLGYETLFFHGAPNGSMGFDAFVRMAGFDRYVGMSEYGDDADYDGTWGIWDEEFLQFTSATLSATREPFLATVLTLSSHHPYKLPAGYHDRLDEDASPLQRVIAYSDQALARFFAAAQKTSWFANTLFVLTADHGSHPVRQEYANMIGRFRVPLLFYFADGKRTGTDLRPAQHIDIMPTLLLYTGTRDDFVAFGRDLFDERAPRFAVTYTDGVSQIIDDEYTLLRSPTYLRGMYRYGQDRLLTKDLSGELQGRRDHLIELLDAVTEQFCARMIDDRLTVPRVR